MKPFEDLLCEAMETYLDHKLQLGLPKTETMDVVDNDLQFLHEQINQSFAIKVAGLTHYDGIRAAFSKVHNYKYVTDHSFQTAMEQELKSQGVPVEEQEKAIDAIGKIVEELRKDGFYQESDAGVNPNLKDIIKVSQEFDGYKD